MKAVKIFFWFYSPKLTQSQLSQLQPIYVIVDKAANDIIRDKNHITYDLAVSQNSPH